MATKNKNSSTRSVSKSDLLVKIVGERIKYLRIKAGYSSSEKFAHEHDINRTQYARYERGADMRMSSLYKILVAHNITLQEFFKGISQS